MSQRVLVTGVSGFIAKHVALDLLNTGFSVVGTIRNLDRADEVKQTLVNAKADVSELEFVQCDLGSDENWDDALSRCDYVQHVASPFPIKQPSDRFALVPAARDGALRVLKAAKNANIKRIVMTSSMVAMMYRARRPNQMEINEDDWSDVNWNRLTPYIVSKTMSEKAAWQWADENDWKQNLVTINPGFVLGPALDEHIGTSLSVIKLFMTGAYPAVPPVAFPVVDVRDLAKLHVRAMTNDKTPGRRLIGSANTITMADMAKIIKNKFPDFARKIPTRQLPKFMVHLISIFDRTLKTIIPDLGVTPVAKSQYVTELTGVEFRPADQAVIAAAQSLIDHDIVAPPKSSIK